MRTLKPHELVKVIQSLQDRVAALEAKVPALEAQVTSVKVTVSEAAPKRVAKKKATKTKAKADPKTAEALA